MTNTTQVSLCRVCGYEQRGESCNVCEDSGVRLGKRGPLQVGHGNAFLDVLRGIADVRHAVSALLFEHEFIGKLRLPVAMNALGFGVIILLGWSWLIPAFTEGFATSPDQSSGNASHMRLMAVWLTTLPVALDMMAGWAQDPIRRATEQHMLGATLTKPPATGANFLDRLQMLLFFSMSTLIAMAVVTIPWVGVPATITLGSAVAGVVWLQPPQAARGRKLRQRVEQIWHNPWRTLGTGFGLQIAAIVPFLNVLALLPVATIASTSAYLHFDKGSPARHAAAISARTARR